METIKTWTMVKAELPSIPEDWAVWIEVYREHGIEGTLQEDAPPSITGYVYRNTPVELLAADLMKAGAKEVTFEVIEEQNWAESWKQFFKPVRIGQHWVVRPTWETYAPQPGDREIVLDPGQAFGTGDHPTTKMCLELLEQVPMKGRSVLDLGCGSGILAVGARLLGADPVVAVDLDPPSIEATHENLERNKVTAEVIEAAGFDGVRGRQFHVIVSNIISATLIRLMPDMAAHIAVGGDWIASGIIQDNWPDVLAFAEREGFKLIEKRDGGEWVAAHLRR